MHVLIGCTACLSQHAVRSYICLHSLIGQARPDISFAWQARSYLPQQLIQHSVKLTAICRLTPSDLATAWLQHTCVGDVDADRRVRQ